MFFRAAAFGVAMTFVAAIQQSAPPPVTSATVRVIRKAADVQFVYVENRRDVPIIEWKITLRSAEARGGMVVSQSYDPKNARSEDRPIAPGETRRQRVKWQGQRLTATPIVDLVVFADGSHAGTDIAVAAFSKEREALAADLLYWQRTLQDVPRNSPREAETYLRGKVRERLQVDPRDPSQFSSHIGGWFGPMRAADWVYTMTDSALRDLPARIDAAVRYRAHSTSRATVEQAVDVRTLIGLGSEFVAVVENLRDTPLEAWDFDIYDSPASRFAHGSQGFDAGAAIDDGQPGGRLRRYDVREVGIKAADDVPDAEMPRVVLRFALWSDLTYEGPAAKRDEHFRLRERQAAQYEFWMAALSEAALKSGREALAFLRDKRVERRRQAPQEPDLLEGNLESWEAAFAREPGLFSARLITYRDRLQEQHRLLTRHRTR
jgi:hypothetical protein